MAAESLVWCWDEIKQSQGFECTSCSSLWSIELTILSCCHVLLSHVLSRLLTPYFDSPPFTTLPTKWIVVMNVKNKVTTSQKCKVKNVSSRVNVSLQLVSQEAKQPNEIVLPESLLEETIWRVMRTKLQTFGDLITSQNPNLLKMLQNLHPVRETKVLFWKKK